MCCLSWVLGTFTLVYLGMHTGLGIQLVYLSEEMGKGVGTFVSVRGGRGGSTPIFTLYFKSPSPTFGTFS